MTQQTAKSRRNRQRSRTKILLAAEALFAREGPSASVNDIAARAGLNKRMIYHYFGGKEGLWQAVLMRQYEKAAATELDLPEHADLAAIVDLLVRRYYRFLAEDKHFVRIILHENLRGGRSIRTLPVAATKSPILQALRSALEKFEKSGQFSHVLDANQLLIDCLALCFFYFSNQATLSATIGVDLSRPAQLQRRIHHVTALLKHALSGTLGGPPFRV